MADLKRILVVDDDPDFVENCRIILESSGYKVLSASSGADGLKKARSEKPNLIILDVMMEHLDTGFSTARTLKQDKATAQIPILMLTGVRQATGISFSKEEDEEGTWIQADAYIEKPPKPEALLAKVKEMAR